MPRTVLEPDEQIEQLIEHKNYLPFRLEDWFRVPICLLVIGLAIHTLITDGFGIRFFFILPVTVVSMYFGIYKLFKRWVIIRQIEYIVTGQRLIIRNKKKDTVEHSFTFSDFPRMTLKENAYNYGFIILGEPAPPIVTNVFPLRISTGINGRDHDIVLENLSEVRKVYNMLSVRAGRTPKSDT